MPENSQEFGQQLSLVNDFSERVQAVLNIRYARVDRPMKKSSTKIPVMLDYNIDVQGFEDGVAALIKSVTNHDVAEGYDTILISLKGNTTTFLKE